jgi:hypothetical protein
MVVIVIFSMQDKTLSLFERLEENRAVLYKIIEDQPEYIHTFKPQSQQWSVLEICYHLIKSEDLSLIYLKKKLHYGTNIPSSGLIASLRSIYLNWALRLPFNYKAPSRVSEFPENLNWVELSNQWLKIRNEMKVLLLDLPDRFENSLVYKHPLAGRLTIDQMLNFFKVHIQRHQNQIVKTIGLAKESETNSV